MCLKKGGRGNSKLKEYKEKPQILLTTERRREHPLDFRDCEEDGEKNSAECEDLTAK